jgi:hypothetical protein
MLLAGVALVLGQWAMVALAPALADQAQVGWGATLGFAGLAAGAGAVWLALVPRGAEWPWPAWLTAGAAMRLPWLFAPPVLNTDWLRYLWDGALVAHGFSPWGAPPVAWVPEALGAGAAALHAMLPFAHLRSIYPGTAQAGFALAHLLAPYEMLGLRLVMLGGEAATLWLMLALLRRAGWPTGRAAIWWCCPLLPVLLVGNAHVDALLVPLLLGAAWAALAARGMMAGVLLGLAAGVKLWPVLLAPLLARALPREAWLAAALGFTVAAGVTIAPLLVSLAAPDAGLRAYAGQWLVNNAPFAWARAVLGLLVERPDAWLRPGAALLGGVAALLIAWRAVPGPAGLLGGMMAVGAVTFYLSPANYPWYALWFLPFAALTAFRPLLLAAVLLPVYWLWFPMDRAGMSGWFTFTLAALHALPVAWALARGWR